MGTISSYDLVTAISATAYLLGVQDGATKRFSAAMFVASKWIAASGAPALNVGDVNDFYLDTLSGDVYRKAGGVWGSPILNIKGIDGNDGTDGEDGIGVPPGGTSGQVLMKASSADYATVWGDASSAGSVSMGKVLALS